jgi:hypothetical protein
MTESRSSLPVLVVKGVLAGAHSRLALFLLAFISLGPTAVIEMKMFTTFLAHGAHSQLSPALFCLLSSVDSG